MGKHLSGESSRRVGTKIPWLRSSVCHFLAARIKLSAQKLINIINIPETPRKPQKTSRTCVWQLQSTCFTAQLNRNSKIILCPEIAKRDFHISRNSDSVEYNKFESSSDSWDYFPQHWNKNTNTCSISLDTAQKHLHRLTSLFSHNPREVSAMCWFELSGDRGIQECMRCWTESTFFVVGLSIWPVESEYCQIVKMEKKHSK